MDINVESLIDEEVVLTSQASLRGSVFLEIALVVRVLVSLDALASGDGNRLNGLRPTRSL